MNQVRKDKLDAVLNRRQADLAVVMENIEDPHNIFAIMRTCDAVGVQDIYVLNTVFEKKRKYGTKSSSSASKWVTMHHFTDMNECVNAVKEKYGRLYATSLKHDSKELHEMDFTQPIALAFGNETNGISDEFVTHCDGTIVIPQVGMIKSLNVSVACAVTLYEAYRQKNKLGHYDGEKKLPDEQYSMLQDKWYTNAKERG
ncbi:MAG: RNA methyltransferase [Flavipsychrobacter sp.]